MYASGRSSSAAGLTAAAVKDEFGEGRWTLEAGALVLADMGLAAIDELDKMDKNDRSSMHEAMEQQSITVNKAGISATLQSRCSILAAANPKFGRFIESKEFLEQMDIPAPLLSRFDLIFTILDNPDSKVDRTIASHILIGHQRGEARLLEEMDKSDEDVQKILSTSEEFKPYFEADFMKRYIAYAKKIIPLFTEEARKKLQEKLWGCGFVLLGTTSVN
jgi:replicative DNA helicase Mcm